MRSQLTDPQREQMRGLIASVVYRVPQLSKLVTELRGNDDFELLTVTIIAAVLSGAPVKVIADFLRANGVCHADLETVFRAIVDAGL
jgi:hypothetical protein